MFEAFEWYCPADHKHWRRLRDVAPSLAAIGIDNMWIPPGCKAGWHGSNGYDIYDLYDLGEFDQKGSRYTKWGTKEELVDMVKTANAHGIGIYWDTVLNHKAAADYSEPAIAVKVDPKDRRKDIGKPEKIEAWTGFDFKGRNGVYSPMRWNKSHFTGTDYDHNTKTNGVWRFVEKRGWAQDVDEELGNYDYLMFADIDHNHPEVRQDIFYWGQWLASQVNLSGLRLDAIKHFSGNFVRDFIMHLDRTVGRNWFIVGEYWREDTPVLARYIEYMHNRISLFDVKLVSNFSRLSMTKKADLRTIFQGSLALAKPANAVTFVQNHDTQDRQSLETPVLPYFMPMAYAIILLTAYSTYPCVFYGDLYGTPGPSPTQDFSNFVPPACGGHLPKMVLARKLYAYGTQIDYFDQPHCIGFTRAGHRAHSNGAGLAVLMTNKNKYAYKRMKVGQQHAGERWTDILKWAWGEVVIDQFGWGSFPVGPKSVGVWVNAAADGREFLDDFVFDDDIYGFTKKRTPPTKDDLPIV